MNSGTREHFREVLEGERDRIRALLSDADGVAEAISGAEPGEESEPGVSGAAVIDDTAVIARQSAALEAVEHALKRLHDYPEHYGLCVVCGRPIGEDRLELVPTANLCARHAEGV